MAGEAPLFQRFWRPVLAWMVACGLASIILYTVLYLPVALMDPAWPHQFIGDLPGYVFSMWIMIAGFTAIPAFGLVWLARRNRWPRGWTDTLLPASISVLVINLIVAGFDIAGWFENWGLGLTFFSAGAIAGFAYWRFAGRPRAPY